MIRAEDDFWWWRCQAGAPHAGADANVETRGWESAFFDAHLRNDAAARELLRPGARPAGPEALGRMLLHPA